MRVREVDSVLKKYEKVCPYFGPRKKPRRVNRTFYRIVKSAVRVVCAEHGSGLVLDMVESLACPSKDRAIVS